ncbi:serine/threonine-protein phosphatase [Pelagicoccus sp. NFK12]|uniref:Serine/threonine-protein phosphatase n=1 Tax=Pelagicoccus enzymogenes TaxID=2773457 RepID=A0A927IHF9_9BACT|nr:protein phosphatase 2C domain-containing protein [Pelagicoccus enzymogenes]MBD5779789.1 serine/threonine-protein phosphatase [Pelagicoccus enzymogenes]
MDRKLRGIAITHKGNYRSNNEDSLHWGPINGNPFALEEIEEATLSDSGEAAFLAAVADGVGGCAAGEEASELAIKTVKETLSRSGLRDQNELEQTLAQSLEEAHKKIVEEFLANPSKDGMATTFTGILFTLHATHLLHIGDSRCYRFRAGHLEQISKDHSPVATMVAEGKISEEEAQIHPYRSYIDRVLGNTDKPIEPVIEALYPKNGDRWLVCSDGLSDSLYREEIESTFNKYAQATIEDLGFALMNKALDRAGRDNLSLVLVEVGSPSLWTRTRQFLRTKLS